MPSCVSGAGGAGLLFFELMFVTFRTLFVALFTWPEEMLIIKKVMLLLPLMRPHATSMHRPLPDPVLCLLPLTAAPR